MQNSRLIYRKASELKRRCRPGDMDDAAAQAGVKLYERQDFHRLLGMYACRWRQRMVFLNGRLDGPLRQIVLAHELGHDALHRSLATDSGILREFTLFNMQSITEYEANAFAAHLLLDNEEVYRLAVEGYDLQEMAQILGTHMNLLLIKLQEMNRLGYDLRLPEPARPDFLKKIEIPDVPQYPGA